MSKTNIQLRETDYMAIFRILAEWLDKNAEKFGPTLGGYSLFVIKEKTKEETDAEVGFALEILGKANLISYEEAAGTVLFPEGDIEDMGKRLAAESR